MIFKVQDKNSVVTGKLFENFFFLWITLEVAFQIESSWNKIEVKASGTYTILINDKSSANSKRCKDFHIKHINFWNSLHHSATESDAYAHDLQVTSSNIKMHNMWRVVHRFLNFQTNIVKFQLRICVNMTTFRK